MTSESSTTAPARPVRILEGQAASDRAVRALEAYFAELDERFAGGFDPALVKVADPDEVTPPRGDFILMTELATGRVLGCGGVRVLDSGDVELRRMWLVPDARGRGLGRFLLRALENRARALGGRRVVLSVNETLTEAIALYESAGYTTTDAFEENPYVQVFLGKDL
ncbi:GNAT family N-acetyltransferase [Georgenia subflava]|uniref:GNAT family N-acetyltransferase n=1 Tax=Georgenia subflava TaxID=1622177 RepID=A0A6N7EJE6_9MICO|nr:GNAT family N-acetyltransferase [Georgenia subflava]MPV36867.1 GNAT family N-acetyltransferase [Georgenia subflava]